MIYQERWFLKEWLCDWGIWKPADGSDNIIFVYKLLAEYCATVCKAAMTKYIIWEIYL